MKKQSNNKKLVMEDLEQVDVYYIPKPLADMYRTLREAVAQEVMDMLQMNFSLVKRIQDSKVEGESIVAVDEEGEEKFRYYLNPQNISEAQAARDSENMLTYLDELIQQQENNI